MLSCDTVVWSNDAENSALYLRNKLHFKIHYIAKSRPLLMNRFDYFSNF